MTRERKLEIIELSQNSQYLDMGLCFTLRQLFLGRKITLSEHESFFLFMKNYKPVDATEFGYWFPVLERQPRIDFLNKLKELA